MEEKEKLRRSYVRIRNKIIRARHSPSVATIIIKRKISLGLLPKEFTQFLGTNKSETESYLRNKFRNAIGLKNFIFSRDGVKCAISGCDGDYLGIDHIRSLSKYPELAFAPSNLRVLCRKHNSLKGNR